MNFELSLIEALIYEKKVIIKNPAARLAREKDRIIKAWHIVVIQQPVVMVKKYIQQHQLALLRMSDYSPKNVQTIAGEAMAIAKELLQFLEFQFRDFLQLDYVLPSRTCMDVAERMQTEVPVKMQLLHDLHINSIFGNTLTSAFEETISTAEVKRLTYRRKLQMEDLLDGLHIIIEKAKDYPERLPRLLISEFCRVNLNSMESYLACKQYLEKELDALATLSDQLHKLKKRQQFLRHCKMIKDYYFTYNSRSLCKGLLDWTTDQKYLLENKSHAVNVLDEGLPPDEVLKDSEKVLTSLSRPVLALMVTLFFKTGVFINRSKAAIARFMALFVRTRSKSRDDHQSPGKMYEDMKNIKISTVDTVDGILDRMKKANNKIRQEILHKTKRPIK